MEKKYAFCRICESGCGFVAEVENNRILKYYPDKDHPFTHGYACIKGRHMLEVQYHPKRLKFPLKKVNGRFERISWDQATEEIGAKCILGQAYLGLGLLHKETGKSDQAKRCLSRAAQIFEQCDAEAHLKEAEAALAF